MLCKCYWIVLYTVHVTAFCLGGPFFSGHGVHCISSCLTNDTVLLEAIQHLKIAFNKCYTIVIMT